MEDDRLRKKEWMVDTVSMATARRLIVENHYARGASKVATFRHGLYRRSDTTTCRGVAFWIPPQREAGLSVWHDWREVICLHRLVVCPDVPGNGASFLISRSLELIRRDGRYRCALTYADSWQGHTGAIYRATNWEYLGMIRGDMVYLDPSSGRMVAQRRGNKTWTDAEMVEQGFEPQGYHHKHKFRLVLKPARRPRSLFDGVESRVAS